jgi:hypothetical protein
MTQAQSQEVNEASVARLHRIPSRFVDLPGGKIIASGQIIAVPPPQFDEIDAPKCIKEGRMSLR